MLKNKFQIPNSKSQINSPAVAGSRLFLNEGRDKSQIPKFQTIKFWSLVIWSLVIVCNLVLGAWNLSLFAQEQFIYDAKGKRDPFIPLVTSDGRLLKLEQEEGTTGLSLEGIIYDKQGLSYAIVNAEVVKIGDTVGDYQVLKIEKNKVIFIKEGGLLEIELKKEEP